MVGRSDMFRCSFVYFSLRLASLYSCSFLSFCDRAVLPSILLLLSNVQDRFDDHTCEGQHANLLVVPLLQLLLLLARLLLALVLMMVAKIQFLHPMTAAHSMFGILLQDLREKYRRYIWY
ncbi:hypothetical protein EJ02DRAFT_247025 [Clathrospora elynae]|uniref:Uncharacterized protein n=1 Tax=Clathrospora elynae TaxID=706981 RepID=A0A6A5SMI6_9PLEO|nr:hypothetical protein EJ02DRAFT_247025 [Clathrospora elynae]